MATKKGLLKSYLQIVVCALKKKKSVYIYMYKYKIKTHLLQGHKIIYFTNDFEKPPTKENRERLISR